MSCPRPHGRHRDIAPSFVTASSHERKRRRVGSDATRCTMKRTAAVLAVLLTLGATTWAELHVSRMKHPFTGQEVLVPGRDGDAVLLPDGWRITPAGRHLTAGDM